VHIISSELILGLADEAGAGLGHRRADVGRPRPGSIRKRMRELGKPQHRRANGQELRGAETSDGVLVVIVAQRCDDDAFSNGISLRI
jgi:hypothetical protein